MENTQHTTQQIRAGMLAAYAAFRSAFPDAEIVTVKAECYDGRFNIDGSVLRGSDWVTGIRYDGSQTIDHAITALSDAVESDKKYKLNEATKLRDDAARLLARAERIEGGAK